MVSAANRKEMRRDRESRFQTSHVFALGRSGSSSQAVIQIAVQKPLYKLTITYWLSTLNERSIPTRLSGGSRISKQEGPIKVESSRRGRVPLGGVSLPGKKFRI